MPISTMWLKSTRTFALRRGAPVPSASWALVMRKDEGFCWENSGKHATTRVRKEKENTLNLFRVVRSKYGQLMNGWSQLRVSRGVGIAAGIFGGLRFHQFNAGEIGIENIELPFAVAAYFGFIVGKF